MEIWFKALTVLFLQTSVSSFWMSPSSLANSNDMECLTRYGIKICFPERVSNSLCNEGISFPEEQYRECIQLSATCDAPGIFPFLPTPSRYFICRFDRRTGTFQREMGSCESGKIFDSRTLRCLNAEEQLVSKSISTELSDYMPHCEKSGVVPNNQDCKSFFVCSGPMSVPLKFYCGPKMYFNDDRKMCTNYMTTSCVMKLHNSQEFSNIHAERHYATMKEILDWTPDKDETSAESDPEPQDTEYEGEPDYVLKFEEDIKVKAKNSGNKQTQKSLDKKRKSEDSLQKEWKEQNLKNEEEFEEVLEEIEDLLEEFEPLEEVSSSVNNLLKSISGQHPEINDQNERWLKLNFGDADKFFGLPRPYKVRYTIREKIPVRH